MSQVHLLPRQKTTCLGGHSRYLHSSCGEKQHFMRWPAVEPHVLLIVQTHTQFLASWRHSYGPDNIFDSFFIAILRAVVCLAKSKGAAALRAPGVQALLSVVAQPDTAALIAHALVALLAREGSKCGARRAWLRRVFEHGVIIMCASLQAR